MGTGENFAGLLTLDLPSTVLTGQEFNVVVRRIGRRGNIKVTTQGQLETKRAATLAAAESRRLSNWRYVIGTFQVKIPVWTPQAMLGPEENTLAILKWRFLQMAPSNRWYAVLQRYISYISDRVAGLGGDPNAIPPSLTGAPRQFLEPCADVVEFCGKVTEIVFDCFGDLEGFVLTDCCRCHRFNTRERELGEILIRACKDRLSLSVFALRSDRSRIQRLVIRN
jgi:hypothetical protein